MSEKLGEGTIRHLGGGAMEITDLSGFLDQLRQAIGPTLDEHRDTWEREKPAAMAKAEALGIDINNIGGNCPVQAHGSVDGKRFYFRARYDEWQFHVADTDDAVFDDGAWVIEREYGSGFDAGWMHKHEAVGFICDAVKVYREQNGDGKTGAE